MLVGHHGLFSLTPVWVLAAAGMVAGVDSHTVAEAVQRRKRRSAFPWFVQPLALVLSVVVVGFYLVQRSRQLRRLDQGLRWLMWLTPIWLT